MSSMRKRKIRISSLLLLAVTLAVILISVDVDAAEESNDAETGAGVIEGGECGADGDNVVWQLDTEGTLTISGTGAMEDYAWTNFVPSTPWYEYRASINKIVVSDGVTSIGSSAFYKLSQVTSVELPDDVLAFKSYAFASCYKLKEIDFPDSLQYIANDCFENCSGLSGVIIPKSVTKFGNCVFMGCSDLTEVQLPPNMETLPGGFFSKCESLKSVVLPAGLTAVGEQAFAGCVSLEQVDLPDSIETLGSESFYNCSNLIKLSLPCNIELIPAKLCYGCISLDSIEIPSSAASIEDMAFYGCSSLNNVILHEGLKELGESVFYKCNNLAALVIPQSVAAIGTYTYGFYKDIYDEVSVMPDVKLYCYEGSVGESYAEASAVPYSIINIQIPVSECEYTGNIVTPDIKITIDGRLLKQGTDFTVEYKNNIDIGTATAQITFINDYALINGGLDKSYQIGKLLNKCNIALDKTVYQYHTSTPEVTVRSGDYTLIYGTDYEVYYTLAGETWKKTSADMYRYLWDLGDCIIKIVGRDQYIGEEEIVAAVNKFDMSRAELWTTWTSDGSSIFTMQDFEYDGTAKKQSGYRVCDDNDTIPSKYYDVSYRNNIKAGTATMVITGKGDYYTGTLEKQFEIYPRAIASVEVTKKPDKIVYSNNESTVRVTGGQFTVCYQDGGQKIVNMKASMLHGDYNLKMCGVQNIWLSYEDYPFYYQVTVIKDLSAPKKVTAMLYGYDDVKVSWSKVTGADAYNIYCKKSTADNYTYLGRTTKSYYKKANLSDGVKYYFKVVPCTKVGGKYYADSSYKTADLYTLKKVAGVKAVKSGSKVKVSWTNISGETGYQISKSTKKSGTNVAATYKTTSGRSRTITVAKGKVYYYKVRAYKVVNGKKIYAPWSVPVRALAV